jgi:membrane-associated phospholipid phosphatase
MLWTLIVLSGFLVATILDPVAQSWLANREGGVLEFRHRIEQWGWYGVFRALGTVLAWGLLALAFLSHDRVALADRAWRERHRRAERLILASIAGGAAAEILKLILRRERPGASELLYSFKPLGEGLLSSTNVGLPSSHAAVAFAGATLLALAAPWSAPVAFAAAAGCGLTRILAGAHHVSDVYAAGVVGIICARWVWSFGRPRSPMDILP